jgi:hypothetical protein
MQTCSGNVNDVFDGCHWLTGKCVSVSSACDELYSDDGQLACDNNEDGVKGGCHWFGSCFPGYACSIYNSKQDCSLNGYHVFGGCHWMEDEGEDKCVSASNACDVLYSDDGQTACESNEGGVEEGCHWDRHGSCFPGYACSSYNSKQDCSQNGYHVDDGCHWIDGEDKGECVDVGTACGTLYSDKCKFACEANDEGIEGGCHWSNSYCWAGFKCSVYENPLDCSQNAYNVFPGCHWDEFCKSNIIIPGNNDDGTFSVVFPFFITIIVFILNVFL